MKLSLLAAVAATLALTACGSTVQGSGEALRGVAQDGSALGTSDGSGAVVGPDGSTGTAGGTGSTAGATAVGGAAGVPGSAAAGAAGSSATTPGSAGSSSAAAAAARTDVPVVAAAGSTTKKPIEIGILLYPNLDKFAKQFGGSANTGDQDLIVATAEKWVNAHGGAAGHPVKVIKHYVDITSPQTYDQLAQQACEDFTVDHHAVAVLAPGTAVSTNFAACLQKRGAVLVINGHWIHDAKDWQQYQNMWSPAEADGAKVGRAMVSQVLSRGLAKRGGQVGLMVMTEPGAKRTAENIVKPDFKAAGIEVVAYDVPPPASTSDIGNSVAVNNSAVLKMAAQNITTVLFLCPGCLGFFADQADSQGYYPTYVASSYDTLAGINGSAEDKKFGKAIALGWEYDNDMGVHSNPGLVKGNRTRALCHTIMDPIKQAKDDLSEFVTQAVCDGFLQVTYAAGLNPVDTVTGSSLGQGFSRFGTRYPSALSPSTSLSPQQHGGASTYRVLTWNSAKHAFAYTGAATPFR